MTPAGTSSPERAARWQRYLADIENYAIVPQPLEMQGTLVRVTGLVLEAAGVRVPVGSVCDVSRLAQRAAGHRRGRRLRRRPRLPDAHRRLHGLASGARVMPRAVAAPAAAVGVENHPWRRSEDRAPAPADGRRPARPRGRRARPAAGPAGPARATCATSRWRAARSTRWTATPMRKPLDIGVRAINAMLTVGRGQRIGLFAGTGVGKSVLLGMMARYTQRRRDRRRPDRRTRPRSEGIHRAHPRRGRPARARSWWPRRPTRRRWCACRAPTTPPPIAEYFRDQGKHVLLLMDSLTRFAMAQREIALAIGEPPATKRLSAVGCFAKLPQLVERSGNGRRRRRLDHRVLHRADRRRRPAGSDRRRGARHPRRPHRAVARAGREPATIPAIDVEKSISRVMTSVAPRDHLAGGAHRAPGAVAA